tara:strand:- start:315 stop:746 length:432 start_codon:yes stop_codon:yes gene_type:complete
MAAEPMAPVQFSGMVIHDGNHKVKLQVRSRFGWAGLQKGSALRKRRSHHSGAILAPLGGVFEHTQHRPTHHQQSHSRKSWPFLFRFLLLLFGLSPVFIQLPWSNVQIFSVIENQILIWRNPTVGHRIKNKSVPFFDIISEPDP